VSKGTYVRSLAADIGRAAGTVAHLGALRRTRIGSACLSAATSLAGAVAAAEAGRLSSLMADPVPLLGMPVLEIDPSLVRDGRRVPAPEGAFSDGECVALVADNLLLGVYRCGRDILIPESVLVPGIAR
jgi:tRNA pseudouridine55 synthase